MISTIESLRPLAPQPVLGISLLALVAEHDDCLRHWWETPLGSFEEQLAFAKLEKARERVRACRGPQASTARPLPYAPEPNLEEDTSTHD